jgi:replicative DNA helicase
METLDLRGELARALSARRLNPKKSGDKLAFRCPRHDDRTASAWMGDHAWGCAACGFTEPLRTLAGELGVDIPEHTPRGLTLAAYMERKGLTHATMTAAGVVERVGRFGEALVAIPYRDGTGAVLRTKLRGPKGTWWDKDGTGAPLYGQDWLARAPITEPVLLVEGESDCHAAWQRGVLAVGLPGASQWRTEYAPLLRDRPVYVWQEPDEGGATLVASVAKDLPKAKVISGVSLQGDVVKDLCDLHQRVESDLAFQRILQQLQRDATPIGAEGPVIAFDSISGDTLHHLLDEKLAPIDAVPTMLPMWNALCGGGGGGVGLARGWFITVGANTGTGKSLVALNLAAEAIRQGEVACIISLEMGRSEIATRYLAIASGEAVGSIEQGPGFDTGAYHRAAAYVDAMREQTGGHLLVNRRPLSKLTDVTQCVRYYAEHHGCRYFLVDYLQLAWTANTHSIHDRMELVAHQLRDVTHQTGVTMIALSQFNRQTSANRSERPMAQGLMGGSAIENDSHQVLLFDHSRFERSGQYADTWLIVDKNRHGAVKDIPVRWDYRSLQLTQRTPTIDEQAKEHGIPTRKRSIAE